MRTIIRLLEDSVRKFGELPYMMDKKNGKYEPYSFRDIQQKSELAAAGLMALGAGKGDRIALLSEGRHEWVVAELGILHAGAISVPLSVKLTPAEIEFRLRHAECSFFIVSALQLKKLPPLKIPHVKNLIVIGPTAEKNDSATAIPFDELLKKGREFLSRHNEEYTKRKLSVREDDIATICYTSGTTAEPKGIMLMHKNYYVNVEQACELFPLPPQQVTLLILPWDHAFAHTAGIYTLMKIGGCIAAVDPGNSPSDALKNIPVNIKETRPHLLLSVPALAKNFRKNIENSIRAKGKLTRALFTTGMKIAYLYNHNGNYTHKGWRIILYPLVRFFDVLVFSKVREAFGGRLKFFVGGGALLDIELQRFFAALGMPMLQGYGLTEASPIISANKLSRHKFGSSGVPAINMEIKICDEEGNALPLNQRGEIVIRGENVMAGYYKNPEATATTLRNGWLHTGDMGSLDKDGFLFVYGRFKSLLIADDGEKYSPEGIEEALISTSPFIEQCMLYNNQHPYTVALIVPNKEAIKRHLHSLHLPDNNKEEAVSIALGCIEQSIKEFRPGGKYADMFPHRWIPSAVAILTEPFTEENGMLNSTMKIVRGRITEHYQPLLSGLYSPENKKILNPHNISAMKEILFK